ncbi:MAG: ShlB/FhaC/HecB family hemolysin secretion/activation protein [Sedimentisphaerales bacterium]|nr:ShlB/FhaC/HecB family hemolysin secretion/activation protein [Sedimentisphaerales bacterium]
MTDSVKADSAKTVNEQDFIIGRVRKFDFKGVNGLSLTKEELLNVPVEMAAVGNAYRAVQDHDPVVTVRLREVNESTSEDQPESGYLFHSSALKSILNAITRTYQKNKIAAVRVNVTRSAIEHLREPGSDGLLTIDIVEGRVAQVRVIPTAAKIQNKFNDLGSAKANDLIYERDPVYERIQKQSAIQPGGLVRLNSLDRYITYLNRHPGRQVDAALAPGPEDGELTLDYLVSESKQPFFYTQISNTGTEQTSSCRQQFGMIHHNLTRRDDILYLDYITGDFDSVHGVSGGYEFPLGDKGPADWNSAKQNSVEKSSKGWTWGEGSRVRAKVFGSWREYEAAEVGLSGQKFRGESYSVGGELAWNFFQHDAFFVDAVTGIQHSRVKVDNELSGLEGESSFLLPYFGLRASQQTEKVNVNGSLIAEFNLPEVANTDNEGLLALDRLGRVNTDRRWMTLRCALNTSFFLEPILDKKWKEPEHHSTLAHELFTSVRGQVTPNNRRVPANYLQTLGGFYTIRGYPESFASGDNALMGTVEYRYHWPRSLKPNSEPGSVFGKPFRFQPEHELGRPDWDLVFRTFFDAGQTSKNDKLNFEDNSTLISSGLGFEFSLRNNMKIRTDWGWPLKSATNGEDDVSVGNCRVHMSLSIIF